MLQYLASYSQGGCEGQQTHLRFRRFPDDVVLEDIGCYADDCVRSLISPAYLKVNRSAHDHEMWRLQNIRGIFFQGPLK